MSPPLFDTLSGKLFNGCGSLSAIGDHLALLRLHLNLVYQKGATTHNPAILSPFGPSRGSFQTVRTPSTSRLASKMVPTRGFALSVPHVAPEDLPIGRWDRRCRVCSDRQRERRVRPVRSCKPRDYYWPSPSCDSIPVQTYAGSPRMLIPRYTV